MAGRRGLVVAALGACLATAVGAVAAGAAELPLPAPPPPPSAALLAGVGATSERTRSSVLPPGGTARDVERVVTAVDGNGDPATVEVEQRITLTGRGDYVVVERGPARRAVALGGDGNPPTLKLGAVLYAGFVPPTGRELAARLTLDPLLEAARLPLALTLTFTPAGGGSPQPLGPGGTVPGPGQLAVSLTNVSAADTELAAGDVPAAALAGPLDLLLAAARSPGARPPVPGEPGVPSALPLLGAGPATRSVTRVVAPLRVTGTVRIVEATGAPVGAASPGRPGRADGRVDELLTSPAPVLLTAVAARVGKVELELAAVPTLDAASLAPPGAASWAAWAARPRTPSERRAGVVVLVTAAAGAGRIRDLSPYLATDLPGDVRTTFDYRIAPVAPRAQARAAPVRRNGFGIALASVAAALIALNLELLRRRA